VNRSWIAAFALGLAVLEAPAWGQGDAGQAAPEAPLQWGFGGEATLRPDRLSEEAGLYDRLNSSLLYRYRFFEAVADFSLARDERYVPDEKYMLGRGFFLENGGLLQTSTS
jgi:hypothetical protein